MQKELKVTAVVTLVMAFMSLVPHASALTPSNDRVENARLVSALPYRDEVDTSDATTSSGDLNCGSGIARTVWYRWTAPSNMDVAIHTVGSAYNTVLGVSSSSGTTCNDDARGESTSRVRLVAISGQTYTIMVGGLGTISGGSLVLNVEALTAPSNDQFAAAVPVSTLPFEDARDVSEASATASDPTCITKLRTVWYSLTFGTDDLGVGGRARITTSDSDHATTVSVWTGSYGSFGDPVGCAESTLTFQPQTGTTYYLMVGSKLPEAGILNLKIEALDALAPPPSNDSFSTAMPVGALDPVFSAEVNTDQANAQLGEPACSGGQRTVWFRFTPSAGDLSLSRVVRITSSDSDYATTLSIYQGSSLDRLNTVACDTSQPELVVFEPVEGTTYYVLVEARDSFEPNILRITFENLEAQSAPPTLTLDMNGDGFRSLLTGSVALQGDLTCSEPLGVKISARVEQSGRSSTASRFMNCDGFKDWSINLFGNFRKGSAFAEVEVTATGDFETLVTPKDVARTVDLIECSQIGSSGDDRLRGTNRRDILCGLAGNDTLLGRGGDDKILAGPGRDKVVGGSGNDFLFGAADIDSLDGGEGKDRCITGKDSKDKTTGCETITETPGPGFNRAL